MTKPKGPAAICREYGLTMREVGQIINRPRATLTQWHGKQPKFFTIVVMGAAFSKIDPSFKVTYGEYL